MLGSFKNGFKKLRQVLSLGWGTPLVKRRPRLLRVSATVSPVTLLVVDHQSCKWGRRHHTCALLPCRQMGDKSQRVDLHEAAGKRLLWPGETGQVEGPAQGGDQNHQRGGNVRGGLHRRGQGYDVSEPRIKATFKNWQFTWIMNSFCTISIRKLSHPKLVQLYGVCSQQKPMYIVTEFMEQGSLLNFLRLRRGSFSLGSLLSFCLDVCEGMEHLEANGFIHRDLVASNFCSGFPTQFLYLNDLFLIYISNLNVYINIF